MISDKIISAGKRIADLVWSIFHVFGVSPLYGSMFSTKAIKPADDQNYMYSPGNKAWDEAFRPWLQENRREVGRVMALKIATRRLLLPHGDQMMELDEAHTDLVLEDDEIFDEEASRNENKVIIHKNGFTIQIVRMTSGSSHFNNHSLWLNGYVMIPPSMKLFNWASARRDYWQIQEELDDIMTRTLPLEITLGNRHPTNGCYVLGWDHNHIYDANLARPITQQERRSFDHLLVSGPPQILQEARELIQRLTILEDNLEDQRDDDSDYE
jgi:hypothetical protein